MAGLTDTPPQPGDRDYEPQRLRPVDLHELCRDVKQIKRALVGDNPMNPSPDSLVSQHADMRRTVSGIRKVAWAGVVGAGGLLLHKLGTVLFGGPPH